jgi:anaerobic ribonucleoside-triphosphate reductase
MIFECPGSSKFKRPNPESTVCPCCGEEVEIWADEDQARCLRCGKVVARKIGASCLDWCKHARQCVSSEAYDNYIKGKNNK